MPEVRTDHVTLSYRQAGAGEPVVLLHGGGLTHRMWDPQFERLADRLLCVAPDMRGHGATVVHRPGDRYGVDTHAHDVIALLDHLGIEQAHLAGLSLGGLTGMQLALDAPHRVRSLITIGAPAGFPRNPLATMLIGMVTRKTFRGLDRGGMRWFGEHAAERLTTQAAVKAYLREDAARNDAVEFRKVWRGITDFDARSRLPGLRVPTMVVIGTEDRNRKGAVTAAKLIPDARLEEIPGAGHITNRDASTEVDRLLIEWVTSHAMLGS